MTSIKRDDNKSKWEQTEFPLVCETCLGDNPYIRMTHEAHGKKCKICETPFTVFAWQAGTKGRLKKVEICKSCAAAKNVCQVCIYDLQYGLPVQVRDRILAEEGGPRCTPVSALAIPQSDANRAWYNAQQERMLAENGGVNPALTNGNDKAALKLQSMARMEPRYERNLPKLCSFFARGECNRGSKCPFRHEMPRDRNDPLSKQNTKDRFYGTNDPVARKMIWQRKQKEEEERERLGESGKKGNGDGANGDERAIATCYVRFDDAGASITISETDVRDVFYSFGEITSVRMHETKGAFVEYSMNDAAEMAILSLNRKEIKGRKIFVNWARRPKRGNEGQKKINSVSTGVVRPIAPPGAAAATTATKSESSTNKSLRSGFAPSSEVAAAARARAKAASGLGGIPRPSSNLSIPRPGGGVIRRAGAAPKAYYPSADPGRLGTRAGTTNTR